MHGRRSRGAQDEEMDVDGAEADTANGEIGHMSIDEEDGIRIGDIYIPPAPAPALTMDGTGPRLIITHIVNHDFKSYAGTQTLGPFHKSFTAIMGPNGSGKSNVIDSMLFVFGYRASKIRSKKISVLLHSSSKHPNVNSASVEVHFAVIQDGVGDAYTVVPNSEIVVSRTAFKDNSSFYTMNGRRVQFKEVGKMLRSHGIDLDHNRFLILQGEVEQIALMKPKAQTEHDTGMLEYLEDIIGTSRYKEPIEKLFVRVEELSDARKEKLNRVRLVEQEKQQLEGPMREAVEMCNLSNDLYRCRNSLLQKYVHETNKLMVDKNRDLDEAKEKLTMIDNRLSELKTRLEEKGAVLSQGMQKYDVLRQQKEECSEKLQTCKRKTVTAQADGTQAGKKKKNLQQLLEQEKGKLIDLEQIPEKNRREIAECETLLTRHNEQRAAAEQQLQTVVASVRTQTRGLQETKDRLQGRLIGLKKTVDEAKTKFKLAESELKIYLSTEVSESEKLEKLKEALQKAESDLDEKKPLQDELAGSMPRSERDLSQAQTELLNLKKEESSIVSQVRTLRSQLEESTQAMSANQSRNKVLNALMNEKKKGNLPGIFGRLGDLGGIDAKYDVAISTCCGALDNIVVDTVETAQQCVEHLKRHNIGRATFVALEKQEHLRGSMESRVAFPENAPRLFDLVRVRDERVLTAFYYALRDTLVAEDLEQASRIAYGRVRYRVVSLNGDVIEIAGTMSGGGRSTMRGRMSSSVQHDTSVQDPEAIRRDERKLAQLEARLAEIRSQQGAAEERAGALGRSVREGKMQLDKLNVELRSLKEQVPLLKRQLAQQRTKAAASKVDPRRKTELEKVLKKGEEELRGAESAAGEVESEVADVDSQISAVAGGKVKELQKAVDEHRKKIDKISTEITKLKVAINTSARNAKKSTEKIAQMETDLADTVKKLEAISKDKRELAIESTQLQKSIEELDEKINEGGEEFSELKREIGKLQSKENKAKTERVDAKNEVTRVDKVVEEFRSRIPVWERDRAALRLEDPGIEGVPGVERPLPLAEHTSEELEAFTVEELRRREKELKTELGDLKPNMQAIQDYKAKEEVFLKRAGELDDITTRRNEMRALYEELRKKRTTDFLCGFNTITGKLKEMYQMITLGGDAELELVDSLDAFTEGITFTVRPPNKSWKNISNLSGGEKTLSSLALVFALHYYKPTPLYVMDEIDAALDFKNVSIVANYIKERTKNAQFIVISLRYNMFETSNRLVGIYKTEDCTKSITIENRVPGAVQASPPHSPGSPPMTQQAASSTAGQATSSSVGQAASSKTAQVGSSAVQDAPSEPIASQEQVVQ